MNIRVLVVDDDRGIVSAVEDWLTRRGYTVTTASELRGERGMAGLLAREQFQLGFFDLNVGLERSVTVIESTLLRLPRPFPFVMMTADSDFQPTQPMIESGFCLSVIRKPLSFDKIVGALDAASRFVA